MIWWHFFFFFSPSFQFSSNDILVNLRKHSIVTWIYLFLFILPIIMKQLTEKDHTNWWIIADLIFIQFLDFFFKPWVSEPACAHLIYQIFGVLIDKWEILRTICFITWILHQSPLKLKDTCILTLLLG